ECQTIRWARGGGLGADAWLPSWCFSAGEIPVGGGVREGSDPVDADFPKRHGIQVIPTLPSHPSGPNQLGALECLEVLHHPEAGHVVLAAELAGGLGTALQLLQDRSPHGIGKRFPDGVGASSC